jgi:CDP-diacylglycerol--glycerol-3-phosphate 3-phosphatidyltransferase
VRITANHVTMARIFLLPVPVYMLMYGEALGWWIAFTIFLLLGATDFIDGFMARKEGPTRLGTLIDPMADKIFITAIVLSMIALNIFSPWVVSVLLSREFLVTALRSSVAFRKAAVKTSTLAKLKTVIQMGGCVTIFLTIVLSKMAVVYLCSALSLFFLAIALTYLFRGKRAPYWSLPVFFVLLLVAAVEYYFFKEVNLMVQISIIIALTWVSAIDYLFNSYRLFKKTGMMQGDWMRIIWTIVHSLYVAPLAAYFPIIVLPILVSMSFEFGLGGIDNMLVAEKKYFSFWPFFFSSCSGLFFSSAINFCIYFQIPYLPFYFSLGLASASSIICGAFFGWHVDLFKRNFS